MVWAEVGVEAQDAAGLVAAAEDFAGVPAWDCGGKTRPVGEYSGFSWITSRKDGDGCPGMWWLLLPALLPAWLFLIFGCDSR